MSEVSPEGLMVPVRSVTAERGASAQVGEIFHQAVGAISARLDTTPDVASAMLRGLSRSQHRELDEYAAEVVARGGRLV